MFPHSFVLPLLLLLCSLTPPHAAPVKYLEVTHPLPTDSQIPAYSLTLLEVSFNASAGTSVASGNYIPTANSFAPCSAVVVELSASIVGDMKKHIAAIWIGGVEIMRTSTVQTVGHGAFWKVRKDVTRYSSVLPRLESTPVSVILKDAFGDSVAGNFRSKGSGTIHVNVSLLYYGVRIPSEESGGGENCLQSRKLGFGGEDVWESERKFESLGDESKELGLLAGKLGFPRKENSLESEERVESRGNLRLPSEGRSEIGVKYNHFDPKPADLIIPISGKGSFGTASWFVIQNGSDIHSKEIKIPKNTYKAALEIYVSAQGSDEFWYSNPPNTYLRNKNPTIAPVNGAFRQVFAAIDSLFVGSVVPFPIVYTEGINPAFWDPVVAIGAFDLPSYELDLTPFLGLLLDGKPHSISLGVSDATSFWLVDANLHLWLDQKSPYVTAKLVEYLAPEISISKKYEFGEEGEFKIKAEKELKFAGWVNSSYGNITTHVENELEFENKIKIKHGGRFKEVEQEVKTETEIKVQAYSNSVLAKASYETKYPLELKIETELKDGLAYLTKTKFSHEINDKSQVDLPSGRFRRTLVNKQESESRVFAQGLDVVSSKASTATTEQKYSYKDERGCFIRKVVAGHGLLLEDNQSNICLQVEEE